jgi:hypothetical protein
LETIEEAIEEDPKISLNIAFSIDFSHFVQNLDNLQQNKNFGQKFVILAHCEGCDMAKTPFCSILKH